MSAHTNKTKEELNRSVSEQRQKLQTFRFAMAGSKTKNVKEGRNLRKEIARSLTELHARKSEARNPKSETNSKSQNV
ncbi:MAG: 50S ribosomal protein L29 [Patescibacteria group bacterium]